MHLSLDPNGTLMSNSLNPWSSKKSLLAHQLPMFSETWVDRCAQPLLSLGLLSQLHWSAPPAHVSSDVLKQPLNFSEVECSQFCQCVATARMAEGVFKTVPIFTQIEDFSMAKLRPKHASADGIMGGFPCQASRLCSCAKDLHVWLCSLPLLIL